MPATLVVPRVHGTAEPPFDFEANDVGIEELAARRAGQLRGRERGRDQRRARMGKRDEAHVVEVVRVRRRPVGERRGFLRSRALPFEHAAGPGGVAAAGRPCSPAMTDWTIRAAA